MGDGKANEMIDIKIKIELKHKQFNNNFNQFTLAVKQTLPIPSLDMFMISMRSSAS